MKNICDWGKCTEIGLYKAPIEKDNSKKFRLLCLEHIKLFNNNWKLISRLTSINNFVHFFRIQLRKLKKYVNLIYFNYYLLKNYIIIS